MNAEYILQSDVLDIIFEKRNKHYGAYTLRKFYNGRLFKSLGFTLVLVTMLCLAMQLQPGTTGSRALLPVVDTVRLVNLADEAPKLPSVPVKPKVPVLPQMPILPPVATQQYTSHITITRSDVVTRLAMNLDSVAIGSVSSTGTSPSSAKVFVPTGDPHPGAGGTGVVTAATNPETPLAVAEIMPQYPGGMQALRKFLEKNLRNPQDLDEGQVVSVKMKFIVGYDGRLKGFETIEDGGAAFNNEVIRVLKKMPLWIPGKSKGQDVSVFYNIPVKFIAVQ